VRWRAESSVIGNTPRQTLEEISDVEAVERARAGDHDAFRILVERYQGRAFRLACRVLRDEELARDAVQDAFIKAHAALDKFEGRSGFYTWLYRLVFNRCIDLKRRDKRDREVEYEDMRTPDPEADHSIGAKLESPVASLERGELRERLAQAIEQLPDAPRRTFLLREVDGLTYAEIAEALEIPKGTVMSRLHHARRRLRELLADPEGASAGAGDDR
jgi:RNA polymerase sigma-70 factor (ECF subfamily)